MSRAQQDRDWIAEYEASHRNRINRLCHTVGIPLITLSLPLFGVALTGRIFWRIPIACWGIGWLFQFIGHAFEGKPPEFTKDWRFLFVGLRWWFSHVAPGRRG